MKKCLLFCLIPVFLLSCTAGGMYQREPCDNLQGQAKDECLKYLPSNSRTAEKNKGIRKYFPTQDRYERTLQTIDDVADGTINYLFY